MSNSQIHKRGAGAAGEPWGPDFDGAMADVYLVRSDPAELEATLGFFAERLGIEAGSVVFDQCCGIGRLAIPLARRGARVFGVDLCEAYIRRARADAAALEGACRFECADASVYVPPVACDAAFNWYSSFGGGQDEACDLRMLRCAREALRPGGRFALDYPHMPAVLRGFQARVERRGAFPAGEIRIVRASAVDERRGALDQAWTVTLPDGRQSVLRRAMRLYGPDRLAGLLEACGFVEIAAHGGVRGEPLAADSPRCIVTATRRGHPARPAGWRSE